MRSASVELGGQILLYALNGLLAVLGLGPRWVSHLVLEHAVLYNRSRIEYLLCRHSLDVDWIRTTTVG